MKDFMHDEFRQIGTDYGSVAEVEQYDRRMREFRDVESENRHIFELCGIDRDSSVLEIGTGTGAFARYAAARCARVIALDISARMLEYASVRAGEERLDNIEFIKAGFLSYQGEPASFDCAVSSLALHHLSDVWKAAALANIRRMLKPGGIFVLADVVFDWGGEPPEKYFERIIACAPSSRRNFARHIADELSTFVWIMRGLLERSGFEVVSDECGDEFMHFMKCRAV